MFLRQYVEMNQEIHFLNLKSKPPFYSNILNNYYRFYIIIVTKGCLFFEQNKKSHKITPGHLVILRKTSHFKLSTQKSGYEGLSISLNQNLNEIHSGASQNIKCSSFINQLVQIAYQEITHPGYKSKDLLESLAASITIHALREMQLLQPDIKYDSKNSYWANCIIQAIEGALYTDKSVEQILEPLQPSYRQLSRYMKEAVAESPKSFQVRRKIEEACKMIEAKQLSITNIAFELGFPSTQHFSTIFKKHTKLSPKQWKPT